MFLMVQNPYLTVKSRLTDVLTIYKWLSHQNSQFIGAFPFETSFSILVYPYIYIYIFNSDVPIQSSMLIDEIPIKML